MYTHNCGKFQHRIAGFFFGCAFLFRPHKGTDVACTISEDSLWSIKLLRELWQNCSLAYSRADWGKASLAVSQCKSVTVISYGEMSPNSIRMTLLFVIDAQGQRSQETTNNRIYNETLQMPVRLFA